MESEHLKKPYINKLLIKYTTSTIKRNENIILTTFFHRSNSFGDNPFLFLITPINDQNFQSKRWGQKIPKRCSNQLHNVPNRELVFALCVKLLSIPLNIHCDFSSLESAIEWSICDPVLPTFMWFPQSIFVFLPDLKVFYHKILSQVLCDDLLQLHKLKTM